MAEKEPKEVLEANHAQVARAYQEQRDKKARQASHSFKVMLVALDCLFLGLQPVLVHMSKNSHGTYSFNPVAVNFMCEVTKTLFALGTLIIFGCGRPGPPLYLSVRAFIQDAHHNRLLAVPAAFYAINNSLKFSMQLFFRPTTTKMLGNLKIFTIALLMRVVMNRTFNVIQMEALFLLVAGITVNQLKSGGACPLSGAVADAIPFIPAALCTLGTVTVPSAASVYNEFALKKHMDTSVHLQNFFLYFFGACFNLGGVLVCQWWKGLTMTEMFAGQSWVTYLLIVNNAAQGILSSFFYKFADTILKKYSSTIATIFTAVMSYVMFGHELTVNFFIGVSIVFISMHQFFSFGDKPGAKAGTTGGEKKEHGPEASRPPPGRLMYSPSLDHVATFGAGDPAAAYARDKPLLPR